MFVSSTHYLSITVSALQTKNHCVTDKRQQTDRHARHDNGAEHTVQRHHKNDVITDTSKKMYQILSRVLLGGLVRN